MNAIPQIPSPDTWEELRENLAGSFTARSHGLLSNAFVFYKDDLEVGRLTPNGPRDAEFAAGTLGASIEASPGAGYALFGDQQVLRAAPRASSVDTLEITRGESVYGAHISFLRNEARAFSADGREAVLLRGSATGRRYRAVLDRADPGALFVAVLLLYHTSVFRRRAFLA